MELKMDIFFIIDAYSLLFTVLLLEAMVFGTDAVGE